MTHLVSINSDVAESSYIFMNKKDTPLYPTTQKITRVLKAFKQGTKTKHIFLIINRNIAETFEGQLWSEPTANSKGKGLEVGGRW